MMPPLSPPATAIREWLETVPLSADLKAYTLEAIENGSPDPMGRLATAVMFRRNVLRIAAARAAGGGRTWLYDFQQPSAVTGMAGHCLELPFTWDCLDDPHAIKVLGMGQPQELADSMHSAWVAFTRTGEPGWQQGTGRVFGGHGAGVAFEDVAALA